MLGSPGDAGAGNTLFERHFDSIYRFFVYKVERDVHDLVQRTFLGCMEARSRFRGDSSFRTFLFAIARNELRQHYRNKTRDGVLDFTTSSLAELAPTPSTIARHKGQTRMLLTALRSLPVDLQLLLELHYLEGLTGPALAEVLEIPEGTVRSRLQRARETAAAKLTALGGETPEIARWADALRACF